MIAVSIPKPPLFSFEKILWFLDRNYDDCLFEVGDDSVTRLIRHSKGMALIQVIEDDNVLRATQLDGDGISDEELINYISHWFDLDRDLKPFYKLLAKSDLSYMYDKYRGLRMVGIPDLFEALCWCVIGQQINLVFAYTLKRRFVEAYGTSYTHGGISYHHFPSPIDLSSVTVDGLKAIQFSRQKADYVLSLAKVFRENPEFQEQLDAFDSDEQRKRLIELRGVGEWTANYVMMKTLGRVDSIPYGDVGLFKALEDHGVITDRKDRQGIEKFFAQFTGWGGYLTLYLWFGLASPRYNTSE